MKRNRLIVFCFLIVGVFACFLAQRYDSKYRYHGKSARDWVQTGTVQYYYELSPEAQRAIVQLGSNAVPELLSLLEETNFSLSDRAFQFLNQRLPLQAQKKLQEWHPIIPLNIRHFKVEEAFRIIGPDARAAIPSLIRDLDSKNVMLRMSAADILGSIGGEAVPRLIDRVRVPGGNPIGCDLAISALGIMRPEAIAAVTILTDKLYETNHLRAVEFALSGIGAAAVPPLLEMLSNNVAFEREKAVKALAVAAPRDPAVLTALTGATQDPEPSVRMQAVQSLGSLAPDNQSAIPPIEDALKDAEANVRIEAVKALGHVGTNATPVVPALIEFLSDTNSAMREQACMALGRIGPPAKAGVPAISTLLNDSNASVHMAATVALMAIQRTPQAASK